MSSSLMMVDSPFQLSVEDLPIEILHHIFSFLSVTELGRVSQLSKEWQNLTSDGTVWKRLCLKKWGIVAVEELETMHWKTILKNMTKNYPHSLLMTDKYHPQITIDGPVIARYTGPLGLDQIVKSSLPFPLPNENNKFLLLEAFEAEEKLCHRVVERSIAYYEVTINVPKRPVLEMIRSARTMTDCISVGLVDKTFPLMYYQPGWTLYSFGYHSDDGRKFGKGASDEYGPTFGPGDTIGCGLDFEKKEIFFTYNGNPLAVAFLNVDTSRLLWPAIGIDSVNTIEVNFGAKPFKYDFKKTPAPFSIVDLETLSSDESDDDEEGDDESDSGDSDFEDGLDMDNGSDELEEGDEEFLLPEDYF